MKLRSGIKTEEDSKTMSSDSEVTANGKTSKAEHLEMNFLGKRFNFVVVLTHFNIFMYATCFWIQIGTMPYLTKKLGVDPVMFGYLQTTFAIVQLCGGPLYGRFGDLFGGRAAMTLAFAAAACSYGLLGLATTVPLLFLSRLPSVFMHAMQGGQMVVTDMTDTDGRAVALGRLGVSYGVGMVLGPFIGGLISKIFHEQAAAYTACAGSLVSMVMCMVLIPSKTKVQTNPDDKEEKTGDSVFNIVKILGLLKQPKASQLLSVKALTGVPIGIFQSMFSVIAIEQFHMEADQNGYILSYVGVLSMIIQAFGISFLTQRFSENALLKASTFILIWAYLMLAFVTNVWQLCIVLAPQALGLTILNVIISSTLTKSVPAADTGAMLGVSMAVNSLIRTVSPTAGGYMLEKWGFPSFGILGFFFNTFVTVYLFARLKD